MTVSIELKCPSCSEPCGLELTSTLSRELPNWEIPLVTFEHVVAQLQANWKVIRKGPSIRQSIVCGKCSSATQMVHWLVLDGTSVAGPYCKKCLKYVLYNDIETVNGLPGDMLVVRATASKTLLRRLHVLRISEPPQSTDDTGPLF